MLSKTMVHDLLDYAKRNRTVFNSPGLKMSTGVANDLCRVDERAMAKPGEFRYETENLTFFVHAHSFHGGEP